MGDAELFFKSSENLSEVLLVQDAPFLRRHIERSVVTVVEMNPPQKFGNVLVDFVESENVLPAKQVVRPPTPKGDVGNPNLVSLFIVVDKACDPPRHLSHAQHGRRREPRQTQDRGNCVGMLGPDGSLVDVVRRQPQRDCRRLRDLDLVKRTAGATYGNR